MGAFTLAEVGLLSGLTATTHWRDAAALQARYPQVDVDPSVLFVDSGTVLTSAGLAAGIDLCLHMVEQDFGAEVALDAARRTVVATRRPGGQAQFMPPDHGTIPVGPPNLQAHSALSAATAWALTNLDQPITTADLARRASMSLRTFNRQFTTTYGMSPGRWLAGQRILVATRLLERTDQSIDRIAAAVGLSPTALRTQFRNRMSLSPVATATASHRPCHSRSHPDPEPANTFRRFRPQEAPPTHLRTSVGSLMAGRVRRPRRSAPPRRVRRAAVRPRRRPSGRAHRRRRRSRRGPRMHR
ncbi:MAG: helix-turn-helix domain-containing protein [Gordonia sp.]|nr:helix-turn-helix domain-containing protein [Gordonia sp. (in: high G+C Gram-positive bacteria)]